MICIIKIKNMTQENKSAPANGGVGVLGVIQIVFIILKCINNKVIGSWPWWKVLLPTIIGAGIFLTACCCTICCVCMIKGAEDSNEDTIERVNTYNKDTIILPNTAVANVSVPVTAIPIQSTNSAFDSTIRNNNNNNEDEIV